MSAVPGEIQFFLSDTWFQPPRSVSLLFLFPRWQSCPTAPLCWRKMQRKKDGWTWKWLRREGTAHSVRWRALIKRDGGIKMEDCLRTLFFRAGLTQEGDGCEDETATVTEGWELLASSLLWLRPRCRAWWKSSSAPSRLKMTFPQIETLSQPRDLSACWKYSRRPFGT